MMYKETIQAVIDCACLIFFVYGIIVLRKWNKAAEKTDEVMNELREELKEADGNG